MSLADGQLRDQVRLGLAQSEQDHVARLAQAWELLAGLFGYRLRPEMGATFETIATLLDATMRGLAIMALSRPGIAEYRTQASPFGAAARDDWSLPALGLTSIASAFLEPDPDFEWDGERLASIRQALAGGAVPDA